MLTKVLTQTAQVEDLLIGWESWVYDLNILTQVQSCIGHIQAHGSSLEIPTHRVTMLLQAAEILGCQGMKGMYRTGILQDESGGCQSE